MTKSPGNADAQVAGDLLAVLQPALPWPTGVHVSAAWRDGRDLPPWVSLADQRRAERLTPVRGVEWLQGRAVLQRAVSDWLAIHSGDDVPPWQVRIAAGGRGEPLLAAPTRRDISLSLAHGGLLVIGIAADGTQRVGIDVERASRDVTGLMRALTDGELEMVQAGVPALHLLVAKEAVAKAWQVGLGGSPLRWPVMEVVQERIWVRGPELPALAVDIRVLADHVTGLCVAPRGPR